MTRSLGIISYDHEMLRDSHSDGVAVSKLLREGHSCDGKKELEGDGVGCSDSTGAMVTIL
jgi:hypothetical protein